MSGPGLLEWVKETDPDTLAGAESRERWTAQHGPYTAIVSAKTWEAGARLRIVHVVTGPVPLEGDEYGASLPSVDEAKSAAVATISEFGVCDV